MYERVFNEGKILQITLKWSQPSLQISGNFSQFEIHGILIWDLLFKNLISYFVLQAYLFCALNVSADHFWYETLFY